MEFDIRAQKEVWNQEYTRNQVIPSTTRLLPSKPLLLYTELLNLTSPRHALDAGCGNGRNSAYLAKLGWTVEAVDLSRGALSRMREACNDDDIAGRIVIQEMALTPPFPFGDNCFDLVLDSYVLCHFFDPNFRAQYRNELYRVTKPGAFLFSSLFSIEDEYYRKVGRTIDRERRIVLDPNNRVVKQLYTREEAREFFSEVFSVRYSTTFEFEDTVLGRTYLRSILALVLEKRLN